jgi:hypothetical protein
LILPVTPKSVPRSRAKLVAAVRLALTLPETTAEMPAQFSR